MVLWIAKEESFAYFVGRILEEMMKTQNIQHYDLEGLCSLDTKVESGSDEKGVITTYVTDIKAIRDCIAHAHHKIRKSDDGRSYILEFEWKQPRRYNFYKSFLASEFLGHTEEYIFFEELQGILLVIAMCEVLMELHLELK
jgi:hypothetical protein